MKHFAFSLDAVEKMRQKEVERCMHVMADKLRQIQIHKDALAQNAIALEKLHGYAANDEMQSVNIIHCKYTVSYRMTLKEQSRHIQKTLNQLYLELDKVKNDLAIAKQRKRAIEILRSKKEYEWKKGNYKKEHDFLDDISQKWYIRNSNKNSHE